MGARADQQEGQIRVSIPTDKFAQRRTVPDHGLGDIGADGFGGSQINKAVGDEAPRLVCGGVIGVGKCQDGLQKPFVRVAVRQAVKVKGEVGGSVSGAVGGVKDQGGLLDPAGGVGQ